MQGPPLTPAEVRQILTRSIERHQRGGLAWDAAVAATAAHHGVSEYKVAALVATDRPPTGLALIAK